MAFPFLHLCLRVENLEKSIAFYEEALGYKVIKYNDKPEHGFTLVFLRDELSGVEIELTYNYGHGPYVIGDGFSHFAVHVEDTMSAFRKHEAMGVTKGAPYTSPSGHSSIYFITDPDGYDVEIIGNRIDSEAENN